MKKNKVIIVIIGCLIVVCASLLTIIIIKNSKQHTKHIYEYKFDANYHWKQCMECNDKKNSQEHSWNDGEIVKMPTNSTYGEKKYTCIICNYTKIERIEKLLHQHTFSNEWSSDDIYHWHSATCEHTSEVNEKDTHNWNNGEVTVTPTTTQDGMMTYMCAICKQQRTETIYATGHKHTYASDWSYNETTHWHASTCNHVGEINNDEEHKWNSGTIIENSTIYQEGFIRYECEICKYFKDVSLPLLDSFSIVFLNNDNKKISELNYELGNKMCEISIPEPQIINDYEFIGWININNNKNINEFDFSRASNNDVYKFKALYIKLHKVTFMDYLDNTLDSVIVRENESINIIDCPQIPKREGYKSTWDMEDIININVDKVVYPIYDIMQFYVQFKDNENNNLGETQLVDYGSFAIAPRYDQYYFNKSAMKLYEFTGWSNSFECVKSDMEIIAIYETEYDKPVIAIKTANSMINDDQYIVGISIIMPNKSILYSIDLALQWEKSSGSCNIIGTSIKSSTALGKDKCSNYQNCTIDSTKEEWLTFNNKLNTINFVWCCGYGHSFNYTKDVINLTFEVDNAKLSEETIKILDSSNFVYTVNDKEVISTKPMIWYY